MPPVRRTSSSSTCPTSHFVPSKVNNNDDSLDGDCRHSQIPSSKCPAGLQRMVAMVLHRAHSALQCFGTGVASRAHGVGAV